MEKLIINNRKKKKKNSHAGDSVKARSRSKENPQLTLGVGTGLRTQISSTSCDLEPRAFSDTTRASAVTGDSTSASTDGWVS